MMMVNIYRYHTWSN